MSTWIEFYNSVKADTWPACDREEDFLHLPTDIQKECCDVFGYTPGSFRKKSKLKNRVFPIKTETACQLKWNWSTVYLTTEETASCHRTNLHKFDTDKFDFHNTPSKIDDRQRMLVGQWPVRGCKYCRDIEEAGGASDRITNLNFPGMHAPIEFDKDITETVVTPRILEVYFDNVCNLKCLYCGPHFSSLWDAENIKYGDPAFNKSKNIESNKEKIFAWLIKNGENLTTFNFLGGEPLYQKELDVVLELFEQHPMPNLKFQIFTNLNAPTSRVQHVVEKIKKLVDQECIREFEITASLDCWGPEQEYVRYPLDLLLWEKNFEYLLSQSWINLIINSTLTCLTIKTLPVLLEKINNWNKIRKVYHYQNAIDTWDNGGTITLFGDIFSDDFSRAIQLKPNTLPEDVASRNYLVGLSQLANSSTPDINSIQEFYNFLNKLDLRRNTNWKKTFPWLFDEFKKYNLCQELITKQI